MKLKQRSKGGVWYAHFNGGNGERLRLSTGTTDESLAQLKALQLMREHLVDRLSNEDRADLGQLTTLSDMLTVAWQKQWRHKKSAAATQKRVGKLIREIGHWPRALITHDRLEAHLNSLTTGKLDPKPLSNASKNRYISLIQTAYTVARKSDSTLVAPALPSWPENNVKERYLSREEERRIHEWFALNVAPGDTDKNYLRDVFVVLLDTGMRCGEALQTMTSERLLPCPEAPTAVHLPHGTTKSGTGRVVPLTERAKVAVKGMLASPLHGKWTSQNAGRQWRTVMRHLGIEGVNLHILRHTTASRLVQAGVDLYQVSTWLGHSSMEVTRRYAHFNRDSLKGALAALEAASVANVPSPSTIHPAPEAHPVPAGTHLPRKLYAIK